MKVKIIADSTVDLTKELIEKYEIDLMPLIINLGDNAYNDGVEFNTEDIYSYVEKTGELPKTSAVNQISYYEFFKKYVDEGYEVIHFSLSSGLSVTHQNALNAGRELDGVYVIDSESLSTGIGIQAIYASELAKKGMSAKDIYEKVLARRSSVQASFVLDKLEYLHKGGRCSSLTLLGANLLKIKPCIEVHNGHMGVAKKYIGKFNKSVSSYVLDNLKKYNNPDNTRVFVTHTKIDPEIVENVKTLLKDNANFKEIIETTAGCTITSHCGPNTIGSLFYNDGNENHY